MSFNFFWFVSNSFLCLPGKWRLSSLATIPGWPIALLLSHWDGLLCLSSPVLGMAHRAAPADTGWPIMLSFPPCRRHSSAVFAFPVISPTYGLVVIVCAVPPPPFPRPFTTTRKLVTWRYFALTSSSLLPATALPLDIGHIAIILRSYDLRRLFALLLTADGW